MRIGPQTMLHRAPEMLLELDTSNNVRVLKEGTATRFGHDALGLVDLCHTPRTVAELVALQTRRSGRALEDLLGTLTGLVEAGVLNTEPTVGVSRQAWPGGGYDAAFVHLTILNDLARKTAFVRGVKETVKPGDTVLDLGTGCGILAIAAVQAGADHVYAVEPAGMVHLAERIARDNGVADRITFIRGWSTKLDLPRKCDVLTTDLVGNEALDMQIWETIADARDRLLVDGARLVPGQFEAVARLVDIPATYLDRHRATDQSVDRWRDAYGIDFSAFVDTDDRTTIGAYERPDVVQTWEPRSEEHPIYTCDLSQPVNDMATTTTAVSDGGTVSGAVLYFRAQLGPTTTFCTSPWEGGETSHWYSAIWLLPEPLTTRPGDRVEISYAYRGDGSSQMHLSAGERS